MDKVQKNDVESHASLSARIDDVVDDLFSELADQIETSEEFGALGLSEDGELAFSGDLSWQGASEGPFGGATTEEGDLSLDEGISSDYVSKDFIKVTQSNIKMLTHCAARVTMLERLFIEAPGYGKLYAAMKNLRELLEYQLDSLTRALSGDFRALQAPPMYAIRRWKMQKRTASVVACPWSMLALAKWKNSPVAFIPEQITYLSNSASFSHKKYGLQTDFPLKDLKKYPWDKLKPLFPDSFNEMDEKELTRKMVPILSHPGVFQSLEQQKEDNYLLLLKSGDESGAVFLDSSVENIYIPKNWAWSRDTSENPILAGHVKVYGEFLPVINIEKKNS